ncbi:MAG: HAD-IIB family hydrolase [Desulfatitalea sp.]|nr:HAD-IIB family hydrolase [Desulfatitalea sp.]
MVEKLPYVQMFSIHGLLRAENMELGRDADTGGQINYVIELARHMSAREDIGRVDLFTRLIADKRVSSDYARAIEVVSDKFRIIRIQCGGRRYLRKELLWPHLDEYIDKTVKFIKREQAIPDIVHGHYPDAGYVAGQLAGFFGVPFVYTGHSLGRSKLRKLLSEGMRQEEIDKKYKIDRRIKAEEQILSRADLVITSTRHEIEQQYGLYHNKDVPAFKVVPPGIDIEKFYPFYHDLLEENERSENARYAQARILKELNRFFMQPDKPLILALCRPDKRKNISGLIQAYGEDLELQTMANLAVFAGIRKDIDDMQDNERDVLTQMLLLMDKYDLYGKLAIPKRHDFEYEVPVLYRVAAEKRGVFINPALTEPFGLTLLEASATGLPIVATNDGGPNDIVRNCENGILIDPTRPMEISKAVRKIIANSQLWEQYSKSGIMKVREHYTWASHAETYAIEIGRLMGDNHASDMDTAVPSDAIGRRLIALDHLLITDIDNTLIGEDNGRLEALLAILERNKQRIGFGVATGRTIDATVRILERHHVPPPDVIISSVGSEIYYGADRQFSQGWATHIAHQWQRDKIIELLSDFDFLTYQEDATQRDFKISYYMDPDKEQLAKIHNRLLRHKCRYNLIFSHDQYLDILPYRASKGKAIRYLSYKWEIPLGHFFVSGDSGNDEEMLRGEPRAVVVGNYSHELEGLRESRHVYFAQASCAGGIIEGLKHYRLIDDNDTYTEDV